MEGGGEAPVIEESGPVENVRDVSEAEEAVQHNQLVDGCGRRLGHDHGKDRDGDDNGRDASKYANGWHPGGWEVWHHPGPGSRELAGGERERGRDTQSGREKSRKAKKSKAQSLENLYLTLEMYDLSLQYQ